MIHESQFRESTVRFLVLDETIWFLASDILALLGGSTHDYHKLYTNMPPSLMKQLGSVPGGGPGSNRKAFSIEGVNLAAKAYGYRRQDELSAWLQTITIPEPEPELDLRTVVVLELTQIRSQVDRLIKSLTESR